MANPFDVLGIHIKGDLLPYEVVDRDFHNLVAMVIDNRHFNNRMVLWMNKVMFAQVKKAYELGANRVIEHYESERNKN